MVAIAVGAFLLLMAVAAYDSYVKSARIRAAIGDVMRVSTAT